MSNHELKEVLGDGTLGTAKTESQVEEALYELIDECSDVRVSTFADVGMLSNSKGLVVRIGDKEFQLTIVRSR